MPDLSGDVRRRAVADVLAAWARDAGPLAPVEVAPAEAVGASLARPLVAPAALPPDAVALLDGLALRAAETIAAAPYSPAELTASRAVAAGEGVPTPFDAVAPVARADEVDAAVAPGANLRRPGEDATTGAVLVAAGGRFGSRAQAVAMAAGIDRIAIRRARVRVARLDGGTDDAIAALIARLCAIHGAEVDVSSLAAVADDADLVIVLGAAAIGTADVAAVAAALPWRPFGPVALRPGETMLAGRVGRAAALLLPGRADAALAAGLALIAPHLDHLHAASPSPAKTLPLQRKLVSAVGVSELALLAETPDGAAWRPLAVGAPDLAALAGATAWALLPPESEGRAAGELFAAHSLPAGL